MKGMPCRTHGGSRCAGYGPVPFETCMRACTHSRRYACASVCARPMPMRIRNEAEISDSLSAMQRCRRHADEVEANSGSEKESYRRTRLPTHTHDLSSHKRTHARTRAASAGGTGSAQLCEDDIACSRQCEARVRRHDRQQRHLHLRSRRYTHSADCLSAILRAACALHVVRHVYVAALCVRLHVACAAALELTPKTCSAKPAVLWSMCVRVRPKPHASASCEPPSR